MATIKPFNGIRYSLRDISPVVCPPYDVVSPDFRKELAGLSPYNLIRVELPESYGDARQKLESWLRKKILVKDASPAFYVCRQEFGVEGRKFERTGFFCIMKLDPKAFIKHEKVSQKPIEDRLSLLRNVEANISPIFGLFEDANCFIKKKIGKITARKPDFIFKDSQKLVHKVWIADDSRTVSFLESGLLKKHVFIADGHHRFTTSMTYLEEMRKKDGSYDPEKPYNYIMIFLCPLDDPGLVMLPTHRVVRYNPDLNGVIKKNFDVRYWDGKGTPSIVRYSFNKFEQLVPKKKTGDISVKVLHSVLDRIYKKEEIIYIKDAAEAVQRADALSGTAFLLDSPPIKKVYDLSRKGEIMPHKTTYFYPKIPAGIVIYDVGVRH
jgi:uncharacterized protein (DUF1015 family)